MTSWAREEMKTADLGDRRLNERLVKVLEQLGHHPQVSIPAACGGWSETLAAYRFFDNEKVTFEQILAPHREATVARMAECSVALLAQDTTANDEHLNLGPKGLGTLKNESKVERRLHPTVAFTPERICLGVVQAAFWERNKPSPRSERRYKGVDEKESGRWVESYQESCALQGQLPNTLLVNIADREGDLYEWYAEYESYTPDVRAQWIVRAAQNRRLIPCENEDSPNKLRDRLVTSRVLGCIDVEVKPRLGRAGRTANVTLRSATVKLAPPGRPGYHLPELYVNAVLAREETPPPDTTPLEWLLLTSLPVTTFEQVTTIVAWYAARWCIEIYFHVLKSGCQIQRLQLETMDRLLPCLALYMIIAWRVLFTLMLGRTCPEIDCEIIFEAEEWQAIYIVAKRHSPPRQPPPLGEVILLIAALGGYLGRKHDGPPGPKAIWIGLQRVRDFVIALEAQRVLHERCV